MAKIQVMVDVPNDDCGLCDYYDCNCEQCLIFGESIYYDEDKDCYERCFACKQAQKECSGWN